MRRSFSIAQVTRILQSFVTHLQLDAEKRNKRALKSKWTSAEYAEMVLHENDKDIVIIQTDIKNLR